MFKLKIKYVFFFLFLGSFVNSAHSMEQKSSGNYFENLPKELIQETLLFFILSSNDHKNALSKISSSQLVKEWHSTINNPSFAPIIIERMYRKFSIEINLYNLLQITPTSVDIYQKFIKSLKTIASYAFLHHNELAQEIESEEYPWSNLEFGAYCAALRKSHRIIMSKLEQGENYPVLSEIVAADFDAAKNVQKPTEVKKQYPEAWDPHYVTAELLYLCENTEDVIKNALNSTNFSERLVQYISISSKIEDMFTHTHAWEPTYLRISDIFRENKDSVKDRYLELSKRLYTFT